MIPLKKLALVLLAAVALISKGYCAVTNEGLGVYKDLVKQEGNLIGSTMEDYPLVPAYVWADYESLMAADKRSGKFKSESFFLFLLLGRLFDFDFPSDYMLNKDAEANGGQEVVNLPGPVIRSYIPRTSSKRVPGAVLNWAFTPQQKAG